MAELSNWRQKGTNKAHEIQHQSEIEFPCLIPAGPNWYLDSVVSTLNGYLSYGGRSSIIIVNLKIKPPKVEKQWNICANKSKKPDRVTSTVLLSLESNDCTDAVAASSSTGFVCIYEIQNKKLWKEHNTHQEPVVAISWCPTNEILVSGDEKGKVSLWKYKTNAIEIWTPKEEHITCLKISPTGKGIVTIGYKDGTIATGNVNKKNKTVAIFKCHQNEVTSISWNSFFSKGDFVSASRDQDVKIWQVGHKKPIKSFEVLPPKGKKVLPFKKTAFTCVCWFRESTILVGQQNGTINIWNTEDNGKINSFRYAPKGDVYSITHDEISNTFTCFSTSRSISIINCDNFKDKVEITTNNGFIYSLTISPFDSHSITVSVADGLIKTWSFGNLDDVYNFTVCDLKNSNSKPLLVSYHPNKEGVYAYGTSTGQVGIYNNLSKHKNKTCMQHQDKVYSVCWGPPPSADIETFGDPLYFIYTVGSEGQMYAHNAKEFAKEAINITELVTEQNKTSYDQPTELAWKPDYTLVAVGYKNGSINLFTAYDFHCVLKIEVHKNSINCLKWHQDTGLEHGSHICCSNLLASSADDSKVCVVDTTCTIEKTDMNHPPQLITSAFRKFDGHTTRVYELAWNPHDDGILATAAHDGTVQVWNVLKNEAVGNFSEHDGRVQSVIWSLNDPDIIYSGGEDCALRRWKVSNLTQKLPPGGAKPKKKKTNASTIASSAEKKVEQQNNSQNGEINMSQLNSNETKSPSVHFQLTKTDKDNQLRKKRKKSLFPKSSVSDSTSKEKMQSNCILLAKYLKAEQEEAGSGSEKVGIKPGGEEYSNLGLYSTRKDVFRLIDTEFKLHEENKNITLSAYLNVWKCSIPEYINKLMKENELSDCIVAISAMGGIEIWRATALAYAQQLEESLNINHAAMYYVALGDTRKAIQLYCEHNYFKEAIVLAKTQLPAKDEQLTDLYLSRAERLMSEVSFEKAAECYLAAGRTDQAIAALAKRGDSKSLSTAFQVAKIFDRKEFERLYYDKCIEAYLFNQDWSSCKELLRDKENYKTVYEIQLKISERLSELLADVGFGAATTFVQCPDEKSENQSFVDILQNIRSLLHENFELVDQPYFQRMEKHNLMTTSPDVNCIFQHICNHVTVAMVNLSMKKCDKAFQHLLKIFNTLYTYGYMNCLEKLFYFIMPKLNFSFQYIVSNFNDHCSTFDYINCYSNFYSYLIVSLLYNSWWSGIGDFYYLQNVQLVEYGDQESVYSLLCVATQMLLSTAHITNSMIDEKVSSIETSLKRLNKKEQTTNNTSKQISENVVSDDVNARRIEEINGLKLQLNNLLDEREQIPNYFKVYMYPSDICSNVIPILYICVKYMNDEPRFRVLFDDVMEYISYDNKIPARNLGYLQTLIGKK